ncbi:MFS monocarboxylate transporter [Aspergillus piperis CBS 112811]|uniref:MFS monocarboxylate transporter n=1 Tax=Aspergillus piperis CBS 112811 TaxID=1448313 RepID=A0A8G1R199_9EURO|nr:MFS monocarboxylate transporter [Aspergillus piperis CBS 112811]RAH57317.1 MFS monocarboxylate transporter [Aspergillus piperis CBS 112811]
MDTQDGTDEKERQDTGPSQTKSNDFPDGGLRAWLVVVGAFFGLFTSFGWTNCVGIFQAYYQTHQLRTLSASTVSWIPAISMFMMFITGPFVGRLFDAYGPRWLLLTGSLLHVFGLMMASLSSQYYQFILSQSICSPLGASMVLYSSFNCVATWFRQKRALAMGITASGSSLGGVIMPILVDHIITRHGFGWAMRICAFLMLGLLAVTNLTVRSRLRPKPTALTLTSYFKGFTDVPFVLVTLASFLYSMGMFIPITYMVTYGEHVGMSTGLAGYLVSTFNAASGIGRILPGYAADKLGNFNISICAAGLSTIFVLGLWLPGHSNATAIVFAAAFGFSSGTYTALSPALVAQISNIHEIGTRSGALYAFMSISALVGSPIGGSLIAAADGEYWKLQVFTGVMLAGGTLFYALARLYLSKGKIWAKV